MKRECLTQHAQADQPHVHPELNESSSRELLLWILRLRRRYHVTGASMLPLLKPGDEVLVDARAYKRATPRPGELVIAYHPHQADVKMIKRVVHRTADGQYHLEGDNALQSTDSRQFGPLTLENIIGRVTCRFP